MEIVRGEGSETLGAHRREWWGVEVVVAVKRAEEVIVEVAERGCLSARDWRE